MDTQGLELGQALAMICRTDFDAKSHLLDRRAGQPEAADHDLAAFVVEVLNTIGNDAQMPKLTAYRAGDITVELGRDITVQVGVERGDDPRSHERDIPSIAPPSGDATKRL